MRTLEYIGLFKMDNIRTRAITLFVKIRRNRFSHIFGRFSLTKKIQSIHTGKQILTIKLNAESKDLYSS